MTDVKTEKRILVDDQGIAIMWMAVFIAALMGVLAFAVDLAQARSQQRRLQYATDAGALAGVERIRVGGAAAAGIALTTAQDLSTGNVPEATLNIVETGHWDFGNDTVIPPIPPSYTSGGAPINAVRVTATRQTDTLFARIWNVFSISPRAESIAVTGGADHVDCLIPFGVSAAMLTGKFFGDTFQVRSDTGGNWGKLDLWGVNMSSGRNFENAMTGPDDCADGAQGPTSVDDVLGTQGAGTGFAQVRQSFNWRLAHDREIIVMPVVQEFFSGNQPVQVIAFIKVEILSSTGGGENWIGTFRILNEPINDGAGDPVGTPLATARVLTK